MVLQMAYNVFRTGVPAHFLEPKIGASLIVIRNVIEPKVVNGNLFILKRYTRNVLHVESVEGEHIETFPESHKVLVQLSKL